MTTFDKVWRLWPSITEMSSALNEGAWGLYKRRERGRLPAPHHDVVLIRRSQEIGGDLSHEDLANWRAEQEAAA